MTLPSGVDRFLLTGGSISLNPVVNGPQSLSLLQSSEQLLQSSAPKQMPSPQRSAVWSSWWMPSTRAKALIVSAGV